MVHNQQSNLNQIQFQAYTHWKFTDKCRFEPPVLLGEQCVWFSNLLNNGNPLNTVVHFEDYQDSILVISTGGSSYLDFQYDTLVYYPMN